jgi:hypothetical protein
MKSANDRLSLHPLAFFSILVVMAILITALMTYYSTSFSWPRTSPFLSLESRSYSSIRAIIYGNSDMLTIPALYNDVVNGVDLSGWKLSQASFFFPDMLLYFLVRSFVPNMFIALSAYGVVQFLIFALGLMFFARQILPSNYGSARYSMIALMAILFTLSIDKLSWLSNLVFANSHHFGVVATIPWVLAISYRLVANPKRETYLVIILSVISFFTTLSDTLYLIQVTVPLCVSILVLYLVKKTTLKGMAILNSVLIFSGATGLATQVVIPWKYPTLQPYFYPNMVYESYNNLISSIKTMLLSTPYQAALAIFFVALCFFVLLKHIASRIYVGATFALDISIIFFPLYFLLASAFNVLALVGSGKMCGSACLRYCLPFLFFSTWWGVPLVTRIPTFIKPALFELVLLVVLALTAILVSGSINLPQFTRNTTDIYDPPLIRCIDENTARLGITYGIAQYWQARPISLLTQNNLSVVQVNPDLTPFHWLNNLAEYAIEPQFAIVDSSIPANHPFRWDENYIINRFGEPDTTFQCGDSKILVYNRSDSSFKSLFSNIALE